MVMEQLHSRRMVNEAENVLVVSDDAECSILCERSLKQKVHKKIKFR